MTLRLVVSCSPYHVSGDQVYPINTYKCLSILLQTTPSMSNSSTNSASSVLSILSLILAPFLALFSFIKLLLFASPQPRQGPVQQDTNRATTTSTAAR